MKKTLLIVIVCCSFNVRSSAAFMEFEGLSGDVTTLETEAFINHILFDGYARALIPVNNFTPGVNQMCYGLSGVALHGIQTFYLIGRDQRVLDAAIEFSDEMLYSRNDPETGRVMWTGQRELCWPAHSVGSAYATYTGAETGDIIEHIVNTARLILETPAIWDQTAPTNANGHSAGFGTTYLQRAISYVTNCQASADTFLVPWFVTQTTNGIFRIANPTHQAYIAAGGPAGGGDLPWNQQQMIMGGLLRLAQCHRLLNNGSTNIVFYEQIIRDASSAFFSHAVPTVVSNENCFVWAYWNGYDPVTRPEDNGHAAYDVYMMRAYEADLGPTLAQMQALANTVRLVMRTGPTNYSGFVDGSSGTGKTIERTFPRFQFVLLSVLNEEMYHLLGQSIIDTLRYRNDIPITAALLYAKHYWAMRQAPPWLSDDLSTMNSFSNQTVHLASWNTDGTNIIYNNAGGGSANRAKVVSETTYHFSPTNDVPCSSVELEFTSYISPHTAVGANRFEVGLIDAATVGSYTGPLSAQTATYGAVVVLTTNYGPTGLLFNDGITPAPGAGVVSVPMENAYGKRTYKVVFTPTGTELFQSGLLCGSTTHVLDFTKDYKIVAYAQDDEVEKSLLHVKLTATQPSLLQDGLASLGNFTTTSAGTNPASSWVANGTDAVYQQSGAGSTGRAMMTSIKGFEFNPDGTPYQSVILEFTSTFTNINDRMNIGLVNTRDRSHVDQIMSYDNYRGAMVHHTTNYSGAGLLIDTTGVQQGAGSDATIGMTAAPGTHTYKLIFTASGTSLFRDGISLGTTTQRLDFNQSYHIAAVGQLNYAKSINQVRLSAIADGQSTPFLFNDNAFEPSTFLRSSTSADPLPWWRAGEAGAIYEPGPVSTTRAMMISVDEFDFNRYQSVTLKFTSAVASTNDRLNVGLLDARDVEKFDNIMAMDTYRGAMIHHTTDYSGAGLLIDTTGVQQGAGSDATIGMPAASGTHTYKVVFTPNKTELYKDGSYMGATPHILDFSQTYRLGILGQLYSTKAVHEVTLKAEPYPSGFLFQLLSPIH